MSVKRRLNSYKGRLNPGQITDGINAARRNALRLVEDAQLLFNNGRYPTAASLAILSIEESGKQEILRTLAIATSNEEVSSLWKEYRTHVSKNVTWLVPQLWAEGAKDYDDFRKLYNQDSVHPYLLEQIKQLCLYSDCLEKAHWNEPSAVMNNELAEKLIKIARQFINNQLMEVKEMELWVKYFGNFDNQVNQEEILIRWADEMEESGFNSKKFTPEKFLKLLGIKRGE